MDWVDDAILSYQLVCDASTQLTNKMVTARKPHACHLCTGQIEIGERCRAESRRQSGGREIVVRRVCFDCCEKIRAGLEPWPTN